MILAGIDEAGLGPAMGPLCTACTAFRVPEDWDAATPWEKFSSAITDKASRKDSRILVTDSKVAHKHCGAAGLEATAIGFLGLHRKQTRESFVDLLTDLGSSITIDDAAQCQWYDVHAWPHMAHADCDSVDGCENSLRGCFEETGAFTALIRAKALTAGRLNSMFDSGMNKSEAAMSSVGEMIKQLVEDFPDEDLKITVDKQGGRNFYLPFLYELFPGMWVHTISEGAQCSEYLMERAGGSVSLRFVPKADATAFCVALASIFAKYLRERFMLGLNAWFAKEIPDLKPTAGYHGDAPRFLEAIAPAIEKHNIPRDRLVRKR